MKNKYGISLISAVLGAVLLMPQFSAMAADKVVVIPLFSSGSSDIIPTVTSKTGRVWMDRNLGAFRVAQSVDDYQAYGWLYQWGRLADGHEVRSSPTTATISPGSDPGHGKFITTGADWIDPQNDNLWQGEAGINNPCPPGFRIPTQQEWEKEVETWTTRNAMGAFESELKLPLTGYRHRDDAVLYGVGAQAYYWSTTTVGVRAYSLYFDHNELVTVVQTLRANGAAARCVKD